MKLPSFSLRARVHAVLTLLAICSTMVFAKSLELQVLRSDFYHERGAAKHVQTSVVPAVRGMIVDRNGEPLAVSTPVESIGANPKELLAQRHRLPELAMLLERDPEALEQYLTRRIDRGFVYLSRHVPAPLAASVRALALPGVGFETEYKRYYPAGEVAAHVVGQTDIDGNGTEGLERAHQETLAGVPGKKRVIRDRLGRPIREVEMIAAPAPGRTLTLTIDRRLQYIAYRELKAALALHRADSGSVVVMEAHSGEIRAMVNYPSYNPNQRGQGATEGWRNRAVTDVFEPGSIIKPFTVAAALEGGQFKPEDIIDTTPGTLSVGRHLVRDVRNFGALDLAGVLKKSSNVAAVRMAQALDREYLWDRFARFGFGELTGSRFPGESPGLLNDWRRWREIDQATLSFGYGLSVTPLQMARAYAVIANGGRKLRPTFVRSASDDAESVLDPVIASQLLAMLESVTDVDGTGFRARIAHYRVAGKTGTARKVGGQGYDRRYVAAFAGIAPASAPRLVVVVLINDPLGEQYYGGQISAPVFARVMAAALRLEDVPPDLLEARIATAPDDDSLLHEGEGVDVDRGSP